MKPFVVSVILIGIVVMMGVFVFAAGVVWPDTFCSDAVALCVRGWIGAFSGWAAALLALAAALIALPPLREQVAEARRLTAFQLGEVDPTIDLFPSRPEDKASLRIRITNWNRLAIHISEVLVAVTDPTAPYEVKAWSADVNRPSETYSFVLTMDGTAKLSFNPSLSLSGWENRNSAPPALSLLVDVTFDEEIALPATRHVHVTARIAKLDSEKSIELTASRNFTLTSDS